MKSQKIVQLHSYNFNPQFWSKNDIFGGRTLIEYMVGMIRHRLVLQICSNIKLNYLSLAKHALEDEVATIACVVLWEKHCYGKLVF